MKYFDSLPIDASKMAEDVVFSTMAIGQETKTPQGVLELLNYFYHVVFDAHAETTNMMFEDGKALIEGYVVDKHIGEFAGIPATGKEIRVPILVIYDLENDQIQRARIYFEVPVLMEQLGVTPGQTQAA